MDTKEKRTIMIYDIDDICSYLKIAMKLKSIILIKYKDSFNILENAFVYKIDTKNNTFSLHSKLELDSSTKKKITLRLLLESSTIDFLTTFQPSLEEDKELLRFSLPTQMTAQYIRGPERIRPSKEHPLGIKFCVNRLKFNFKVLDISTSGIAVKVPNAELLLDIGDTLNEMEIFLTESTSIRVSGEVRLVKGEKCGIKFISISAEAERIIAQYIERKKLVDLVRDKLYVDVEKEVMKFQ